MNVGKVTDIVNEKELDTYKYLTRIQLLNEKVDHGHSKGTAKPILRGCS
jgi:hypothetical protein